MTAAAAAPGSDPGLEARLAELRARIADATARRGPGPQVRLVAVSKHHPAEAIARAYALGQRCFGENYAQELVAKRGALDGLAIEWHFVGRLQRNKVGLLAGRCALIHSVDRAPLADALAAAAQARHDRQAVLVQVNLGEPHKGGVEPAALWPLLDRCARLPGLELRGLMALPAAGAPPAALRRTYSGLAAALEGARARFGDQVRELSIGMSDDFELAIEHGATLVRIGTALFGPRAATDGGAR